MWLFGDGKKQELSIVGEELLAVEALRIGVEAEQVRLEPRIAELGRAADARRHAHSLR